MSKLKIFLVLLMCSACFAIPFKVETVKEGSGDPIRAGQLIRVHYKSYVYLDSVKILAEKARLADSLRIADSLRLANDFNSDQIAGVTKVDTTALLDKSAKSKKKKSKSKEEPKAAVDTVAQVPAVDSAAAPLTFVDSIAPVPTDTRFKLFSESYPGSEPLDLADSEVDYADAHIIGKITDSAAELRYLQYTAASSVRLRCSVVFHSKEHDIAQAVSYDAVGHPLTLRHTQGRILVRRTQILDMDITLVHGVHLRSGVAVELDALDGEVVRQVHHDNAAGLDGRVNSGYLHFVSTLLQ
jgi:hypothetical protein